MTVKIKMLIGIPVAAVLGLLLWSQAQTVSNPSWEQPTMGTVCHITLAGPVRQRSLSALRNQIDRALTDVKRRMSIWDPDSEISRFNSNRSPDPFPVSPEFAAVMQRALKHSEDTAGAFDPTVKPLVDHWGFGPENNPHTVEEIMDSVGWQKIRLENSCLIKTRPEVQLDLAAIAKGYGVDRVADVIRKNGVTDFIVEIGGEIVAEGTRSGNPWRIGIETPDPDKGFGEEIFRVITVRSGEAGATPSIAMATSGDYRNARVRPDGTRYSHIINPRTGEPFESDTAAVTVIADRCMDADAVATALCVMGAEAGLLWLETHPEYQAFFILHDGKGSFTSRTTKGFPFTN